MLVMGGGQKTEKKVMTSQPTHIVSLLALSKKEMIKKEIPKKEMIKNEKQKLCTPKRKIFKKTQLKYAQRSLI
jgi:hypothetical protein